jgi:hypothetical protein
MDTPARMKTIKLVKALFKPGTPQSLKDRNLDAKERIITERPRGFFLAAAPFCES